jgi:hypothetical protein
MSCLIVGLALIIISIVLISYDNSYLGAILAMIGIFIGRKGHGKVFKKTTK